MVALDLRQHEGAPVVGGAVPLVQLPAPLVARLERQRHRPQPGGVPVDPLGGQPARTSAPSARPHPAPCASPTNTRPGHPPVDVGRAERTRLAEGVGQGERRAPLHAQPPPSRAGRARARPRRRSGSRARRPGRRSATGPDPARGASRRGRRGWAPARARTATSSPRGPARGRRGSAGSRGSTGRACSRPSWMRARKAPSHACAEVDVVVGRLVGRLAPHAGHPQHARGE